MGLFLYQTFDAIDGTQARRTGQSGPLGEMFDHGEFCSKFRFDLIGIPLDFWLIFAGVDALNTTLEVLIFAGACNLGQGWKVMITLFACTSHSYNSSCFS